MNGNMSETGYDAPNDATMLAAKLWDKSGAVCESVLEDTVRFMADRMRSEFVGDMVEMIKELESAGLDRLSIAERVLLEAEPNDAGAGDPLTVTIRLE